MKITVSSEIIGTEIVNLMASQLAASAYKVAVKEGSIKTQVINKEGNWVDFDPAKIRFTHSFS